MSRPLPEFSRRLRNRVGKGRPTLKKTVTTICLLMSLAATATPECERWFFDAAVAPGTDQCRAECAAIAVGMGTFSCPQECPELCKTSLPRFILDNLVFANGLLEAERQLISKYPKDAWRILQAKGTSSASTKRLFGKNGHNDESDAFRHMLWAGLSAHDAGAERARLFLDAHERNPNQPEKERVMDSKNNEAGIAIARELEQNKIFSVENAEKAALKVIESKKASVLSPKGRVPVWSSP